MCPPPHDSARGAALELHDRADRLRRRRRRDLARLGGARHRERARGTVVPRQAKVALLARCEADLDVDELLVRQVEERRLGDQQGVVAAVARPLEARPLEERVR